MDISPRQQDSRHSQDSLSPSLLPHQPSNADLAILLVDAYRDAESLRKELLQARKATEKAERVYQILNLAEVSGTSPASTTNGDQSGSQHHKHQIKMIVDEYDRRIARAEAARDEAEERRREAVEAVRMLDELLSALDREGRSYIRPILALEASTSPSSSTRPMAPPSLLPSRHLPRQNISRLTPFPLPPHPNTHSPSASTSTRRPRTPSLDGLSQPPAKKARPTDESRGREPRVAYSESYISNMTSQNPPGEYNGRQILPQPPQRTAGDPKAGPRIINRDYRGLPQRPNSHSRSESHSSASSMDVDEMILKATTGDEGAAMAGNGMPNGRHYPDSPQHQPAQMNIQQQQQAHAQMSSRSSRRLIDREMAEDISPRQHSASVNQVGSLYPQQQAHQQLASSSSYAANQVGQVRNIGGSGATGGGGGQGSQSHVYTTHVFAPPMTGAPTKKPKFPNSAIPLPSTTTTGSSPVPDANNNGSTTNLTTFPAPPSQPQPTAIPPAIPFAATNDKGQRICRQCGIVGRYKDGKCVEKWGPGPCGPGTVCDRCRKKMKRVERRGTMESQQQQQQLAMQVQPQQHQPRPTSHAQQQQQQPHPSSQGSDRLVQRSDTLLTTHASLGPSGFGASRSDLRDREESAAHPAPPSGHGVQLRPSGTSHASGAQQGVNTAVSVASTTTASLTSARGGAPQRHQPTPPSIASLREQYDEDDEDDILLDKDQLPTSNIGRGRSAAAAARSSRSSSRNGPQNVRLAGINGGAASSTSLKRSALGTTSSRAPSDEVDADAEADAEAEAEAEILGAVDAATAVGDDDEEDEDDGEGEGDVEVDADADAELLEAVDAAEANSNGSSHGGERSWLKSES